MKFIYQLIGLVATFFLVFSGNTEVALMANAGFIVKPEFDKVRNFLTWRAGAINKFITQRLRDSFSFWQRCFNVFGWMRLNDQQKFVIHEMQGVGLIWQCHNSCQWTPGGSFKFGSYTIDTPCRAKINEQFCIADLFDSCFKEFINHPGTGPIDLTADGITFVNNLLTMISQQAVVGAVALLTAGGYFDPTQVQFTKKAGTTIVDFFSKAAGCCTGWLMTLKMMGLTTPHLNMPIFENEKMDSKGNFSFDVCAKVEDIVDSCEDLDDCIDEGGVDGEEVVILMDMKTYKQHKKQYWSDCINGQCLNNKLRREEKQDGTKTREIYYINGLPIIPFSYPKIYTKFLTGDLRFIYVTPTRNIYLAGSFTGMPNVGDGLQGLAIQKQTMSLKELGMYYLAANQLFGNLIARPELICGGQAYVSPELKAAA